MPALYRLTVPYFDNYQLFEASEDAPIVLQFRDADPPPIEAEPLNEDAVEHYKRHVCAKEIVVGTNAEGKPILGHRKPKGIYRDDEAPSIPVAGSRPDDDDGREQVSLKQLDTRHASPPVKPQDPRTVRRPSDTNGLKQ
jgi:hypothetical protein